MYMPARLIIIVGLPGSGKTTHMQQLLEDGEIAAFYDDFQARAIEHDKNPRLSRHFAPLVTDLRRGKSIAASDIRYCMQPELNRFLAAVIDAVPDFAIDIRYFENDPKKCAVNVRQRGRENLVDHELGLIAEFSENYRVPNHTVTTLKVHTEHNTG